MALDLLLASQEWRTPLAAFSLCGTSGSGKIRLGSASRYSRSFADPLQGVEYVSSVNVEKGATARRRVGNYSCRFTGCSSWLKRRRKPLNSLASPRLIAGRGTSPRVNSPLRNRAHPAAFGRWMSFRRQKASKEFTNASPAPLGRSCRIRFRYLRRRTSAIGTSESFCRCTGGGGESAPSSGEAVCRNRTLPRRRERRFEPRLNRGTPLRAALSLLPQRFLHWFAKSLAFSSDGSIVLGAKALTYRFAMH